MEHQENRSDVPLDSELCDRSPIGLSVLNPDSPSRGRRSSDTGQREGKRKEPRRHGPAGNETVAFSLAAIER